ncbi:hypothetical protein [Actinokineospora sp. NPDC004072]
MRTVTCPYCRSVAARDRLVLSCMPGCGADAASFPARDLRRGRCPHGRAPQARRCCPECDRAIPREYAEAGSRTIVVAGTAGAGKSTWVTEVIRHLSTGEGAHTGLSADLLGEDSRGWRAGSDGPILLSLRLPARVRPVVLALYERGLGDWPGRAAGVVLLIDPTRLPGVRPVLGLPPEPLAPVLADLPPRTPVAVAVSKLDQVRDMFDVGSPLRQPSPHGERYVEADGVDVHHEVASWLTRWAGITAGHRYFALSAHDGGYRVADPLLWLLTRFGAFRVTRGRR